MSYSTKNYTKQGGETTVIGGTLKIEDGGALIGFPSCDSPATESLLGGVKAEIKGSGDTVEIKIDSASAKLYAPTYPVVPIAENQADTTAGIIADLKTDFNALLSKLKTSGLMTTDE